MATIERFEDLECWKKARELCNLVYEITSVGDFSRDFELKKQIRRAAISAMSNIAEGFERDGNKEFSNFLSIAKGSSGEVRSQSYVALDQAYITKQDFGKIFQKCLEVSRCIKGLMSYLQKSEMRGSKYS